MTAHAHEEADQLIILWLHYSLLCFSVYLETSPILLYIILLVLSSTNKETNAPNERFKWIE